MVIYHSPVIAYLLPKTRSDTLALPNIDPDAFYHIYVWMSQDKLDVLADYTRSNISTGIQDACTLLCRMFAAASHLEIAGIQPLLLEQLEAAFAMARNEGRRTPVAPRTVMEVWEYDGEEYVLWKLLLEELCVAFSNKPRPVYAEYEQCLEAIPPLRLAVANAIADRILFGRGFKVETV